MNDKISVSAPKVVLSAILTTSVLMACTPSQHPESVQSQVEPPLIAEHEFAPLEAGEELASVTTNMPQPISLQDDDRKHKLAKIDTLAQVQPAVGRSVHAERMTSPMAGYVASPLSPIRQPSEPVDRENYEHFDDNQIRLVAESPVSTFSIDVDTGSYSNIRRMINAGILPREDSVRVEELINYFAYDYAETDNQGRPFSITTEVGVTPWNPETHLIHVGIKGHDISAEELPASNLVFLVDVSGSMNSPAKLGLLKSALKMLSRQMRTEDRISIVVYAGASGIVLEPVAGNQSAKIANALDSLSAGGSTNGAAGIRSAYQLAEQAFIRDGINRVILATDGDFNVGTVNFEALKDLVEEKRKTGISLTTLGFGTGNYNDHLMEQLADAGNGNYSYIDTLNEAQKVLVDEMSSTLNTIAKDVKIQVEFNPAVISQYRLIGYENRALKREDFNNDKVDAGDIGAGHTVTALYEVALNDSKDMAMDPLRYSNRSAVSKNHSNEIAHLRLRYKEPDANRSKLVEEFVRTSDIETDLASTSARYRFSASVAGFGQLLRGGKYTDDFAYDDVLALARKSRGDDRFGYRGEFISLVNLAKSLTSHTSEELQASR